MWEKIVNNLSKELNRPQFEGWIKPIKFLKADETNIYLAVPSEYFKNWVITNLKKQISGAIKEINGTALNINLVIDESLKQETNQAEPEIYTPVINENSNRRPANHTLNLKYTFDSFVVGTNNKFAYEIAKTVGEKPGKAYNPLFIYGGVGLGKTHLMQAVGHKVLLKHPNAKVKYTTTEKFTNELVDSIRRKSSSDFRSIYRNIDVLLLDDVQFLERKEATQEELFNTFNALHEAGKQIVLSSDRAPKRIPDLEERLVSRFEWGITVDIQPPDLETRIAILKNKALSDKMNVPDDVLELIASAYQHNIRELEGNLNRVIAYISITGLPMCVNSVRGLIESTSNINKLSPEKIIEEVAAYYKISTADIKGASRLKEISNARQVATYLIREITQLSFPAIGDIFGKKHSTIIYTYDKIKEDIQSNRSLQNTINELTSRLN
jgi:chromosomal replication initiator protein